MFRTDDDAASRRHAPVVDHPQENQQEGTQMRSLSTAAAVTIGASLAGAALAQTTNSGPVPAAQGGETVMPTVRARGSAEPAGRQTLRANTSAIGKGRQELRDIPQSVTVVTERLIDDRNLDTLKDALKNTGGVSFQAAEGGEEDIRLRGFSLQSTGDIFIDGMRDPAFYDRDSFNWDRLEVLRGSASMLFGRGSTGGAVNQVSKQPGLLDAHEISGTVGGGGFGRLTADVNRVIGENAAVRMNFMQNSADNWGAVIDKQGVAPTVRWGIGTRDEFSVGLYHLENRNGVHYGLPWLTPGPNKGGDYLWPTHPKNFYGMASDVNETGTTQLNASHLRRLGNRAELRTALRVARYTRDLRASAIRFGNATLQPSGVAVTSDSFSDATVLTRGTNNKVMDMGTVYLQSDYSGRHRWLGRENAVQAGVDLAREDFENFAATVPAGVTLTKPRTSVGTPADGATIDESLRALAVNRRFQSSALGLYVQDLVQVAPHWKVLAGLRWDRFEGDYENVSIAANANNPCSVAPATKIGRTDSLLSKRFGVLYQPTPLSSYHFSYGTSFNTSGDTYQFDAGNVKTDPESSRNVELGAKLDSPSGDATMRVALFHTTKYNERNRDAESVNACNYVLSGKRHAAGVEFDLAGRITPNWEVFSSFAFIPAARVDASSGAAGTEPVGSRPGLTPRFSGTVWSTYKVAPRWRVGGGLNLRSSDKPVGLAATSPIVAPKFITADLMAEYTLGRLAFKASLANVTNKHYADYIYRGHYIPGRPRTLLVTTTYRFN